MSQSKRTTKDTDLSYSTEYSTPLPVTYTWGGVSTDDLKELERRVDRLEKFVGILCFFGLLVVFILALK